MSSGLGFGPAGVQRFTRNSGRSITGEGIGTIRYPSPFFDIAHTYLPSSFKTMLRWCRYYFLSNPLINAVCYKMAEYPVTDLVFDTENEHLKNKWSTFFKSTLQFKRFEVEAGLDHYCYGNAFISIFFPFVKYLQCPSCNYAERVDRVKYTFKDYKFFGSCKECGSYGDFKAIDRNIRSVNDIRLIRWDPEQISIQNNPATGESLYYYTIPAALANDMRMSKRHIIERIPQIFIEALRQNKSLLFDKNNLFHLKRATIAQKDKGWGLPMILPVLKDTFYLQILRKAQESIAVEHIVPLRVLFPQSASGTSDVYCVSLSTLVETRDGPKPASEVRVGDLLKSHKGSWKKVEALADRPILGEERVYKFQVASLAAFPFEVSEEHPIFAVQKLKKSRGYEDLSEPDWVQAKDLKKGDFVLYPVRRKTWDKLTLDLAEYIPERAATERYIYRRLNQASAEVYEYLEAHGTDRCASGERQELLGKHGWSTEDYTNGRTVFTQQESVDRIDRFIPVTEDLAYLIGLYAAEGYLNQGSPCFALHSREEKVREEIDRIVAACGFRNGFSGTYRVSEQGVTHNVHDVLLGTFLRSSCGDSAVRKKLPRFILEAPEAIAMAAARGLLAGDGCNFNTETRRIGLSSVSTQLVVGLRSILLSAGFIPMAQVRVPKEDEISKLPSYQLNLNGAQADALAARFGWSQYDWSQGNKCWSRCGFIRDGYAYLRINEVEEAPEVKTVRGFQMAGDKSFCVVGVATHNSTINLQGWKQKIESEILRWRLDNNYIPILPLPIGQQTLGADGRALMLAQEYRVWAEHIVAGMGVPVEFVFGGLSYSGSNVSMRILENHFLDNKADHHAMVNWIMENVGAYMEWHPIPHHFKRFKMADDLQRAAYHLQLNQAGKLSDRSLLEETDWDSDTEAERIATEQKKVFESQRRQALSQAQIQGEAQLTMQKYQLRAQKLVDDQIAAAQNPVNPGGPMQTGLPPSATPGVPGVISPNAQGQMMNEQVEQMNMSGMGLAATPPALPREPGGQPSEIESPQQMPGESPLNASQNMGADLNNPMSLVTSPGLQDIAKRVAAHLDQMPDAEKQKHITQLRQTNPQLYSLVAMYLHQRAGAHKPSSMLPQPLEKPARRGKEATTL